MPNNEDGSFYTSVDSLIAPGQYGSITIQGQGTYATPLISYNVGVDGDKGYHPNLVFTYIKKKFAPLSRIPLERRLKAIEKAFDKAVENGQEALGKKILKELAVDMREAVMVAKGVKSFVERDDILKYKYKVRGGHIADTLLKDFTRPIPDKVMARKKEVEECFDGFVVYHYWNDKIEEARPDKLSGEEKSKMRDPILFGYIKEVNRLYFVADWKDEYCDLTFREMVQAMGKDGNDVSLAKRKIAL